MQDMALEIEAQIAERQADAELEHVATIAKMEGPDGYRLATETLKQLAEKNRSHDARRKALTKPLDDTKKSIIALFRPASERLEKAIAILRAAIAKHDAAVRERMAIATEETAKQLRAGNVAAAMSIATEAAAAVEEQPVEGVTKREIWRFRITDEALVPDKYWVLDEKAIGAEVRTFKKETNIPGVEAYPETITVLHGNEEAND